MADDWRTPQHGRDVSAAGPRPPSRPRPQMIGCSCSGRTQSHAAWSPPQPVHHALLPDFKLPAWYGAEPWRLRPPSTHRRFSFWPVEGRWQSRSARAWGSQPFVSFSSTFLSVTTSATLLQRRRFRPRPPAESLAWILQLCPGPFSFGGDFCLRQPGTAWGSQKLPFQSRALGDRAKRRYLTWTLEAARNWGEGVAKRPSSISRRVGLAGLSKQGGDGGEGLRECPFSTSARALSSRGGGGMFVHFRPQMFFNSQSAGSVAPEDLLWTFCCDCATCWLPGGWWRTCCWLDGARGCSKVAATCRCGKSRGRCLDWLPPLPSLWCSTPIRRWLPFF